jgi:hypothetical protein
MSGQDCPTAEELARWLDRPAGRPGAEPLAAHVDGCTHCQQVLEALTAGTATAPHPTSADSAVLGRLKQEWPGPPSRPARAREAPAGPPELRPPGALPRLEEEVRRLLRRRLLVVSVVAGVTFLGLILLWASGWANPALTRFGDALGVALAVAAAAVSLGSAAALVARKDIPLGTLRGLELLGLVADVACFAKFRYSSLTAGLAGPWEGPEHRALFVSQATLASNVLFNFLIVCYGVLIPNTWRRCVGVVAALAPVPLAITLVAGLRHEAVRAELPFLLGTTALGLFASSALAVFGSFKLSRLSQEAFLARQLGQSFVRKRRLIPARGWFVPAWPAPGPNHRADRSPAGRAPNGSGVWEGCGDELP